MEAPETNHKPAGWRRLFVPRWPRPGLPWPRSPRRDSAAHAAAATPSLPDRVALEWLLATGVLAAAPLALELPVWVSAVFALAVMWRYASERLRVYRPGRFVRYGLLVIVLFAVYRGYGTVLGRDPGLAFLVALLGLKLLELRSQRDATFTLFLFYVVLAGGFLFGQTLVGGLWAMATVVISVVALIQLQQVLPPRPALRLAGELLLKALPLLLIFYTLFPRMSGTLWGMPSDSQAALTGMSEEMRPGTINDLTRSPQIAFRVDFIDGRLPPARALYWRGPVLTHTDGRAWKYRTARPATPALQARSAPVQYRVTLEPSNTYWLFALDLPATAPPDAFQRPDFTLIRNQPVRERISYTLTSYPGYVTLELDAAARATALALPPVSARVRAFAETLRQQQHEPEAIAKAALDYFRRENFVYTLQPPLLGNDPVDQFLFETRRGFCEHYAAAFATLMRAAGVPARVVLGYQGGEVNPTGNYLIVRQGDAHAWNEIWLDGRGWVRFDPTAAIAPERVELGIDAVRRLEAQGLVPGGVGAEVLARVLEQPWFERGVRQLRLYWDYTNVAWYRWVVDYRKERQENFLRALGFETIAWPRVLTILGGSCALIVIGYAAWMRRTPPPDPAQRLYLRFCRKLARAGVVRAPDEGPLVFAARARAARPDLSPSITAITERYLDLRYGPRAGNDDLRFLTYAVARFRAR